MARPRRHIDPVDARYAGRGYKIAASKRLRNARRKAGNLGPLCGKCGTEEPSRFPTYKNGHTLCRSCRKANGKAYVWFLRTEVVRLYGGKCACCGETTVEFLSIDHLRNNGADERRKMRETGVNFYRVLLREGVRRPDLVLACYNCNCSRGYFGMCPHSVKANRIA